MGRKRIALLLSLGIIIGAFLIVGASFLYASMQPNKKVVSNEEIFDIGVRYVEEKYGTDYSPNGVFNTTYEDYQPNGTVGGTYPTASFRVPADWQKPGTLVSVLVDPETGEIVKILTYPSKPMPPELPSDMPPG